MRIPYGVTTKRYAIIGDPIAHSLSPVIYNLLFKNHGLDCIYLPVNVLSDELHAFMESLDIYDIEGFNVTTPHKKSITPYLNVIEEKTLICGAVNTVVKRDGLLYGYSTDAEGVRLAMGHFDISYEGKNVLIIGAGAITPSIALDIAEHGAKSLAILNRTVVNAQSVARLVTVNVDIPVAFGPLETEPLCAYASKSDLVLNTSSIGLKGSGHNFDKLDFIDYLPDHAVVFDVIYSPPETRILACAKQRGLQVINGIYMLIYQAFAAFEQYTGIMPSLQDFEQVFKALGKYLKF